MAKSFAIEQSYYFDAPPEKVLHALSSPDGLVSWVRSRAEVGSRKGGSYAFDWSGGYHMAGPIRGLDKNKTGAYSWHDRLPGGELVETLASFKLRKKGDGSLLRLRHTGFHAPEHFAECASRWGY